MCRPLTEPSSKFLKRLNSTVDNILNKKKKKPQKPEEEELPAPNHALFTSGTETVDLNTDMPINSILFNPNLNLIILDEEYEIDLNPPGVEKIKLPGSIMAGFPTYPYRLQISNASVEASQYDWYTSDTLLEVKDGKDTKKGQSGQSKWNKRSQGYYFTPTKADIGRLLKLDCTPKDAETGRSGCTESVSSSRPIEAGPGVCPFEKRHVFTREKTSSNEIRMVTYNLLADLYADSEFSRTVLHPQCPAYALEIDYRYA